MQKRRGPLGEMSCAAELCGAVQDQRLRSRRLCQHSPQGNEVGVLQAFLTLDRLPGGGVVPAVTMVLCSGCHGLCPYRLPDGIGQSISTIGLRAVSSPAMCLPIKQLGHKGGPIQAGNGYLAESSCRANSCNDKLLRIMALPLQKLFSGRFCTQLGPVRFEKF